VGDWLSSVGGVWTRIIMIPFNVLYWLYIEGKVGGNASRNILDGVQGAIFAEFENQSRSQPFVCCCCLPPCTRVSVLTLGKYAVGPLWFSDSDPKIPNASFCIHHADVGLVVLTVHQRVHSTRRDAALVSSIRSLRPFICPCGCHTSIFPKITG
jgi:hypothetical protein